MDDSNNISDLLEHELNTTQRENPGASPASPDTFHARPMEMVGGGKTSQPVEGVRYIGVKKGPDGRLDFTRAGQVIDTPESLQREAELRRAGEQYRIRREREISAVFPGTSASVYEQIRTERGYVNERNFPESERPRLQDLDKQADVLLLAESLHAGKLFMDGVRNHKKTSRYDSHMRATQATAAEMADTLENGLLARLREAQKRKITETNINGKQVNIEDALRIGAVVKDKLLAEAPKLTVRPQEYTPPQEQPAQTVPEVPEKDEIQKSLDAHKRELLSQMKSYGLNTVDLQNPALFSFEPAISAYLTEEQTDLASISTNVPNREKVLDKITGSAARASVRRVANALAVDGLSLAYIRQYQNHPTPGMTIEQIIATDKEYLEQMMQGKSRVEELRTLQIRMAGRTMNALEADEVLINLSNYLNIPR